VKEATHHLVETACPLDCPDSCSLSITVHNGRIDTIDGSHAGPVTGGFICAKVRQFADRVYGADRLHSPGIRTGPKGAGQFEWVDWNRALDHVAQVMQIARDRWGAESVLPFSYGGSNGLLSQDTTDARLFRRFGASRLARTVCAAPTGAANLALYGKMASVSYQDYVHARLIVIWGANPSASAIHLVPYVREAQRLGATLVVIDPRSTQLGRLADLHLAVKPGTDVALAMAVHRYLFDSGRADHGFLAAHARGADRLRERAAAWTFEHAAEVSGVAASQIQQFAEDYADATPALIRCGWGLERNRNGGNAAMAVLALPAVAGKFGIRGGGFSMSNSASWNITRPWIDAEEPPTRIVNMNHLGRTLVDVDDPPVKVLFVYNCNPLATMPDQNRVRRGLEREDLATIVFEQVMTDTARYADVVLPATTFLEHYDLARAYGPISLQLAPPVIDAVAGARPNVDVFAELGRRLGVGDDTDPSDELEMMVRVLNDMPASISDGLRATGRADPPWDGTPVQFVDVFPRTADQRIDLFPDALDREAPLGLYSYQPDPATAAYPLALISPATEKTISSTLGELGHLKAAVTLHPLDAAARNLEHGDRVRVFNELGEVRCVLVVDRSVRTGTAVVPKGLWCRSTENGATANALAPDTLTDIGGGACFNDARVEVAKLEG
jgi:anaerobic selenocysteine-containing dehydrogenase